jgi:hypothetical protein
MILYEIAVTVNLCSTPGFCVVFGDAGEVLDAFVPEWKSAEHVDHGAPQDCLASLENKITENNKFNLWRNMP